jgi:hypothetical protein
MEDTASNSSSVMGGCLEMAYLLAVATVMRYLPSNACFFSFHYSGFEPVCHNMLIYVSVNTSSLVVNACL